VKEIYVILAFHAHEPTWELPQKLLENIDDVYLKQALKDRKLAAETQCRGTRHLYGARQFCLEAAESDISGDYKRVAESNN